MNSVSDTELEAFLDEALSADAMARLEQSLRTDKQLLARLTALCAERDGGTHSLGGIWRAGRLSCPTRQELGSLLLGVLDDAHANYLRFHLEVIGCRPCQANLADLQAQQVEVASLSDSRRRRYFQSSAGKLRTGKKNI